MTTTDWLTLSFSIISIGISIWAAVKASNLSSHDVRLSRRAELHQMLLELDRELLHDPSLYGMFKSCPVSLPPTSDPLALCKQDAYIAMYLNLFELSFALFKELRGISQAEREISEAWDRFIASFFDDCDRARSVWERHKQTYYTSFRDYIDRMIASRAQTNST